jgi:hypothetical protein
VPRDAFRLLFPLPVPSACLRAAAPSLAPSQGDELLFTSNTPTIRRATLPLSSHQPTVIGFGSLPIVQRHRPYYISYFLSPSVSPLFSDQREEGQTPYSTASRLEANNTTDRKDTNHETRRRIYIHSMSYYNKASEARNGYDENYDLVSFLLPRFSGRFKSGGVS